MRKRLSGLVLAALAAVALGWGIGRAYVRSAAAESPPPSEKSDRKTDTKDASKPTAWTTAVEPKPLTPGVKKGLSWLVEHQHLDGGWSQGEESPNMRNGEKFRDRPDVADTCIAALALIRSGSTPREGPYKDALAKAVRFVRAKVEASDSQSLLVSDVQGTRVQQKLGPNIDTFLASLLLAEVKGKMADEPGNKDVDLALNKVLDKVKKHQKADGSWDNRTGWAPVLAQGIGGKGLNRARQAGAMVSGEALAKAEGFAVAQFQSATLTPLAAPAAPATTAGPVIVAAAEPPASSGLAPVALSRRRMAAPAAVGSSGLGGGSAYGGRGFSSGMGSAGVELYARSSNLSVLQDSVNTSVETARVLRDKAKTAKTETERTEARDGLARIEGTLRTHGEAQKALLARLDDAQFVSGFGSNGGEEFLSYMNISESLVVKGGLDWKRWDDAMAGNLGRVQNDDGSWSGHHCITGRTFCTSSALLVLMADRTPVPVVKKGEGTGAAK